MIRGGKHFAASFGLAGGIAAAALIVVFLPFATLALVHFTGWDWWLALAAAIALNLIPVLGQLGMLALAVIGAFTLGQGDLAQRKAMPPAAQVSGEQPVAVPGNSAPPANGRTIAGKPFEEWRRTVAAPAIQQSCLQDVQRRGLTGSAQLDQMARACACYGAAAETIITQADVDDDKLSPTQGFNERLAVEAKKICQR